MSILQQLYGGRNGRLVDATSKAGSKHRSRFESASFVTIHDILADGQYGSVAEIYAEIGREARAKIAEQQARKAREAAASAPVTVAAFVGTSLSASNTVLDRTGSTVLASNGLTAEEEIVRRAMGSSVEQFIANREAASK